MPIIAGHWPGGCCTTPTSTPVDRFAGLRLRLYAQPAGRTVTLTTNRITQRILDR
jgi:hypothetical protein